MCIRDSTASDRTSFHRYSFQDTTENAIKIDGGFFLGELDIPEVREAQQFVGSEIEVISDTEVRGYTRIRGGWNAGKAYTVYYYAEFDQPCSEAFTFKNGQLFPNQKSQFDSGDRTGVDCKLEDHASEVVNLKIGISFVSSAKAEQNLRNEIPHWDFQGIIREAEVKWENLIGRIELSRTATEEQKTMFYTALYHTMLMPVNRAGENPLFTATPYYDDFYAIWDTFRTSSPLLTLISPIFVYILLTRISGVTMLERRADKKWGDDPEYQLYKETTSSLIPMAKRKNKEKK